MPQKKYYNRREDKMEELLTDYFECGVCGNNHFTFTANPEFLAGRENKKFIQRCESCGTTITTDKNAYVKNRDNYILASKFKASDKLVKPANSGRPRGYVANKVTK